MSIEGIRGQVMNQEIYFVRQFEELVVGDIYIVVRFVVMVIGWLVVFRIISSSLWGLYIYIRFRFSICFQRGLWVGGEKGFETMSRYWEMIGRLRGFRLFFWFLISIGYLRVGQYFLFLRFWNFLVRRSYLSVRGKFCRSVF